MKLNRRNFLQGSAMFCAACAAQPAFPVWLLSNADVNDTKLLLINLNGGIDGLAALQPISGSTYSTLSSMRPTLALAPSSLLAVDSNFGFHSNLSLFKSLYDEGSLSAILNVGYKNMSRSHLDAEIAVTKAIPDRLQGNTSGLINRIGAAYSWSSLRAISVTGSDPIFSGGDYRGVQANSLDDLYFRDFSNEHADLEHLVNTTYSYASESSIDSTKPKQADYIKNLKAVIDTTDSVKEAVTDMPLSGIYPSTQFGRALRSAEIAFRAPQIASQIVYMRNGGFDTHSNQDTTLGRLMNELNAALTVFVNRAKANGDWSKMIIMIFSEFGRTNKENGSIGTDHGGANPVFLCGGRVNGGGIIGEISSTDLTNLGWLPAKYNYAELYRRVLERMDIDKDKIIPTSEGPSLSGLFV